MKYKLVDWEINRYHDSDGQLVYFDTKDGELHLISHWSTSSPSGMDMSEFKMPTPEIIKKAKAVLAKYYFGRLKGQYKNLIERPDDKDVMKYINVVLTNDFKGRKQGFFAAGTQLIVKRVFLSFFAPHRYNREPYRHDWTVECIAPDGRELKISLDKITLDMGMPSDKKITKEAITMSNDGRFQDIAARCAWLSNDWAAKVENETLNKNSDKQTKVS